MHHELSYINRSSNSNSRFRSLMTDGMNYLAHPISFPNSCYDASAWRHRCKLRLVLFHYFYIFCYVVDTYKQMSEELTARNMTAAAHHSPFRIFVSPASCTLGKRQAGGGSVMQAGVCLLYVLFYTGVCVPASFYWHEDNVKQTPVMWHWVLSLNAQLKNLGYSFNGLHRLEQCRRRNKKSDCV